MNSSLKFSYAPVFSCESEGYLFFLDEWINKRIVTAVVGIFVIFFISIFNDYIFFSITVSVMFFLLFSPPSLKLMMHAQYRKSLALYEKSGSRICLELDEKKISYEYGLRRVEIFFKDRPRVVQIKDRFLIVYCGLKYIIISLDSLPSNLACLDSIVAIFSAHGVQVEYVDT